MIDLYFFHGTSSARLESIRKVGFSLTEERFHNWLASRGTYFVCNRPLIAGKFAEEAAGKDGSEPVVLSVPIKIPVSDEILDLTNDEGMNLLFESYEQNQRILGKSKFGSNIPADYATYLNSIQTVEKDLLRTLNKASALWKDSPRKVNWDVLAIESLIISLGVKAILAVFQEGTTFNCLFTNKEPQYNKIDNFRGIRIRDHIELCLVDTSYIDYNGITELKIEEIKANRRFKQLCTVPLLADEGTE